MPAAKSPGYSGTPLAKKLGITEDSILLLIDAPAKYRELFDGFPSGVTMARAASTKTTVVHLFATERKELASQLTRLRKQLGPSASIWVSWPKKTAKVPTNITEDTIRDVALPMGFVDIKVCAVSEVWSGLKLVVRKELR
jgi:Protein of unknown function (DUF3052)